MACALLIGDCSPLRADDVKAAGHDVICVSTAQEAWRYLLPIQKNTVEPEPNVVIIAATIPEKDRNELMGWVDEETTMPTVLALAHSKPSLRSAHAYYSEHDSPLDALNVVVRLMNGVDRNC